MFIKQYGNGPRIFLGLHGWSGDHRTFAPLAQLLPEDVTLYAFDLPGCGESPQPAQWTVDAIAGLIAEAAQAIPAPFTLIGNCSGALLGIRAAQLLGARVERLFLIDILGVFPWYFRIFLVPVLGPVAYYSTFANPIGRWIANASLSSKRTANTTLTGGFARTSHLITYRYLKLFEKFPAPEAFQNLSAPIDIVYGERTFAAVIDSLPQWLSVWPQARAWRLTGAGHLPIQEATAQMNAILCSNTVS